MVQFNADVADGMPWKFVPTQREVILLTSGSLHSHSSSEFICSVQFSSYVFRKFLIYLFILVSYTSLL